MRIEKVEKVVFNAEELKALQIIDNMKCGGIPCDICPFSIDDGLCMRNLLRKYLKQEGLRHDILRTINKYQSFRGIS